MANGCCRKCRRQVLYVRNFDGKPVELTKTPKVYVLQPDLLNGPAAVPVHKTYVEHKCKCPDKEKAHGQAS